MDRVIQSYQNVVKSLLSGESPDRESLTRDLDFVSKRLDYALVYNLSSEKIEADRDAILWLLANV